MLPGVLQGLRLPRSLRMYRYTGMQRDERGASVFAYTRTLRVNTGADVRVSVRMHPRMRPVVGVQR